MKPFVHVYLALFQKNGEHESVLLPTRVSASTWAALAISIYTVMQMSLSTIILFAVPSLEVTTSNYIWFQGAVLIPIMAYMFLGHFYYRGKMTHPGVVD